MLGGYPARPRGRGDAAGRGVGGEAAAWRNQASGSRGTARARGTARGRGGRGKSARPAGGGPESSANAGRCPAIRKTLRRNSATMSRRPLHMARWLLREAVQVRAFTGQKLQWRAISQWVGAWSLAVYPSSASLHSSMGAQVVSDVVDNEVSRGAHGDPEPVVVISPWLCEPVRMELDTAVSKERLHPCSIRPPVHPVRGWPALAPGAYIPHHSRR